MVVEVDKGNEFLRAYPIIFLFLVSFSGVGGLFNAKIF